MLRVLISLLELKDECQRVNRVTLECVDFMKPCLHGGEMRWISHKATSGNVAISNISLNSRRFNDSLLASVSNNWNQKLKASIISVSFRSVLLNLCVLMQSVLSGLPSPERVPRKWSFFIQSYRPLWCAGNGVCKQNVHIKPFKLFIILNESFFYLQDGCLHSIRDRRAPPATE